MGIENSMWETGENEMKQSFCNSVMNAERSDSDSKCNKILSVSIAAYNVFTTIEKALCSLLLDNSRMSRLDIIVVNDGSTDNTKQLVDKYAKEYPQSIRIIDKKNGGYGSTINTALSIAQGKYFKLLDGDDWYDKDAFSALIDFLDNADADLVVSPYWEVGAKKVLCDHIPEIPINTTTISSLLLRDDKVLHMHGLTINTNCLRQYGHVITEGCFYTDNEYVYCCIAASQTIVRYDKAVYCYRLGEEGQSISLSGMRRHIQDIFKVVDVLSRAIDDCSYSGAKKELLEGTVSLSIYWTFCACMLLDEPTKSKELLKEFDDHLRKELPVAYKAGTNSRMVRNLRRFRYHFYGLFCRYIMRKHGWK